MKSIWLAALPLAGKLQKTLELKSCHWIRFLGFKIFSMN